MSWIEKVGAPDWAESKPQIAINGDLGVKEIEILVPRGRNQIEWMGEHESEDEITYCLHFAYRWKETSKAIYYKWVY